MLARSGALESELLMKRQTVGSRRAGVVLMLVGAGLAVLGTPILALAGGPLAIGLGLIAALFVAGMGGSELADADKVRCPECKSKMRKDASRCHRCGAALEKKGAEAP